MKWLARIMVPMGLAGCSGTAWNTTVADNMAVRAQIAGSVRPGETTETAFVTRWGQPVQKVRDGGQVDYIYRNMRSSSDRPPDWRGQSTRYVIVTFQYGIATAVRTSDTEICRATFAPRPPGYGHDNPTEVRPVETCPGLYRPVVGKPALPRKEDEGGDPDGIEGAGPNSGGGPGDAALTKWPRADPIRDDVYIGDPSDGK